MTIIINQLNSPIFSFKSINLTADINLCRKIRCKSTCTRSYIKINTKSTGESNRLLGRIVSNICSLFDNLFLFVFSFENAAEKSNKLNKAFQMIKQASYNDPAFKINVRESYDLLMSHKCNNLFGNSLSNF